MLFLHSEYIVKLLLSFFLGGLLGFERELQRKPAGLRTHILVSLSATLFTLLSLSFGSAGSQYTNTDLSRVAAAVLSGIGFIGTGVILGGKDRTDGITTAASIWMATAIGMAVGIGEYGLAMAATFLTFFVLWVLKVFERVFLHSGEAK